MTMMTGHAIKIMGSPYYTLFYNDVYMLGKLHYGPVSSPADVAIHVLTDHEL